MIDLLIETGLRIRSGGQVTVTHDLRYTGYVDALSRVQSFMGKFPRIETAAHLSPSTPVTVTVGRSKVVVAVTSGSDLTGGYEIAGASVNRNTAVKTLGDTDSISVDGATTDSTIVDPNGFTRLDLLDAYISSKWFEGEITFTTLDLDCTIDVYQAAFDQFRDMPNIILDGFDVTAMPVNKNGYVSVYLYKVAVLGSKTEISPAAELVIETSNITADRLVRMRIDDAGVALNGQNDGFCMDGCFGRENQQDWQQVSINVLATRLEVALIE